MKRFLEFAHLFINSCFIIRNLNQGLRRSNLTPVGILQSTRGVRKNMIDIIEEKCIIEEEKKK